MAAAPRAGKGKGKHTVPPPIPVFAPKGSKGIAKGTTKGRHSETESAIHPVPAHLVAPSGSARIRIRNALRHKSIGTLWEGLDPWGESVASDPYSLAIDYERLRAQWTPPPLQTMRNVVTIERDTVLDGKVEHFVEITIKALKLTPQLVSLALTQNLNAVSQDQAQGLANSIMPHVARYAGLLRSKVQQRGANSLNKAESIMWALAQVPNYEARVSILVAHHTMEDKVAEAESKVSQAELIVQQLQDSKPLRTLLHSILVVRNVLSQEACTGFQLQDLGAILSSERLRRSATAHTDPIHFPSTLQLVSEILLDTHAHRCRLRFLRMMAVGRMVPGNAARKTVWGYVDDLQDSLLDVFPLLDGCTNMLFDSELLTGFDKDTLLIRRLQLDQIPALLVASVPVEGATSPAPDMLLGAQLAELGVRAADAATSLLECRQRLVDCASRVCGLAGNARLPRENAQVEDAGSVIAGLRHLGKEVHLTLSRTLKSRMARDVSCSLSSQSSLRRKWAMVDTSMETLYNTADLDLVRDIREGLRPAVRVAASTAPQSNPSDVPEEAKLKPHEIPKSRAANLMHGGPQGEFVRDPVSKRWVSQASLSFEVRSDNIVGKMQREMVRIILPRSRVREKPQAEPKAATRPVNLMNGGPEGIFVREPDGHWAQARWR